MHSTRSKGRRVVAASAREAFAAFATAILAAPAAMAQTWEINAPTTVSADVTADYTDIVAHEVLTFQRGAVFKPETGASTTNYIGTAAGDAGGLVFSYTGSGSFPNIVIPSATHNVFSGGLANPAVLLFGGMQDKIYLWTIDVSADAVTAGDEIPFATLSYSGSSPHAQALNCNNFWNYNTKPAVIVFDGGSYRMVYNTATGFRVPEAANKIILRGVNGNDIVLAGSDNATYRFPYSDDAGTIATDGECDLRFEARQASKTFWVLFNKAFDDGQLDWGHTGETRFKNAKAQLCADNALPYSATADRTNRVELISGAASGHAFLDLNGHSAKSGSLFVGAGAYVTNSAASTPASLVFCENNLDATFSGEIVGDVTLVKKGTGTLTIADGSVIPKIKLDGAALSTVVIDGAATVGEWDVSLEPKADGQTTYTIGNGETFDVAPFGVDPVWRWDSAWTNLYLGSIAGQNGMANCLPKVIDETRLSNGLHRVTVTAGGTALVDVASGDTEKYEYMALTGAGTLRKTGTGAATILGDNRVSLGKLHVAEGTLKFQGRGCTNEWWRFTVTENGNKQIYLGKLGLFDEFGGWTAQNLSYDGYKSTLPLGQGHFTYEVEGVDAEPSYVSNFGTPKNVFVDKAASYGLAFTRDSKTVPVFFTMHLANDKKPSVWHSISMVGSNQSAKNPSAWTLETSTNGETWQEALSVSQTFSSDYVLYYWRNDRCHGSSKTGMEGLPWRIGIDNALASVAALGTVRVDDGATLDLSATKNATVSSLEIDADTAGGTMRGGALAASGTVNVVSVGWPTSGETVLTLDGVTDAANVNNWTVSLNGVTDYGRQAYYDSETGNVVIRKFPLPTVLSFR